MELERERWTTTGMPDEAGCAQAHTSPKARASVSLPGVRVGHAAEAEGDGALRPVPSAWYGADADYPADATLHALVQARARRAPHAPALVFGGETVAYAEMDARAEAVARGLRALGTGPERTVGLCVDRSPAQIIGLLGILKAGGAYVPIDTAAPPERRAFVLGDARAVALVADASGVRGLEPSIPVLRVDQGAMEGEGDSVDAATGPDSLAYVLYTSGSTGRPKGVLGTHRGMVNLVSWQTRAFAAGPGERVLGWAPLSFDAASAETFTALTSGAALVLATREQMIPGRELLAVLRDQRVTNLKVTPSALAALPFAELPDLRVVITGGEALTAELVERWAPGRRFFNVFGPTETSVRGAATEVFPGADGRPPIGRPLPNARMYVLDDLGDPAPVGEEGELCIGGVGVARGYLGRPGRTAGVFVPDPFHGRPGARLYRTGDRGRWRPDGMLEFLGRRDDQVKVRGFRVEPGEAAAALREVPGVREGAVVARRDEGETRLVAYWTGDAALTTVDLRRALEKRLLDHMVPSAFVRLDALPLTAHGKLDRRALPAPQDDAPTLDAVLRAAAALAASGDGDAFAPVHARVARRAAEAGADVVPVDGWAATVEEIDARAGRIAARLRRLTSGRGERIAVALEPSADAAAAILAALKAGASAVVVDPRDGRPSPALEDAAVAVTRSCVAARLPLSCAVLSLDADAELIARERPAPADAEAPAEAMALVLGGVPISHALLAASLRLPRETLRGVPVLAMLAALAGEGGEGR